jgi:hypothetical protein
MNTPQERSPGQLLHLVFDGELEDISERPFSDLAGLDIVGIFPEAPSAHDARKARARASVDNAGMRDFVVPLHRMLDPALGTAG